jgi:Ser/Thr protein kinase RdoA (MazF antagonist)
MSLRTIVQRLGVEPERVRLIKRGGNTHWSVVSGRGRFVLRQYGTDGVVDRSPASIRWEHQLVTQLAARGYPALAAQQPARELDGATYALFPYRRGVTWRFRRDEADYRRLGALLADYHAIAATLGPRNQRAGWRRFDAGTLPARGGVARRDRLLTVLRRVDVETARLAATTAREIEPRIAASGVRSLPALPIHGDFSPWNLAFHRGSLSAVLDFDLAHLDLRAADVCFARRGYHDAVVRGYRERAALSDPEVAVLDALWKASLLLALWRLVEVRGAALARSELRWTAEQLVKTRPYRD